MHGTPDHQRGLDLAVELMRKTAPAMGPFWTGIQYRFNRPPSDAEIRTASEWFLANRRSGCQTITFFVDDGSSRYELPCPHYLDPPIFRRAMPAPEAKASREPVDSEGI